MGKNADEYKRRKTHNKNCVRTGCGINYYSPMFAFCH